MSPPRVIWSQARDFVRECCEELREKRVRREVFKNALFWAGFTYAMIDLTSFLIIEPLVSEALKHTLEHLSGILYRTAAVLGFGFVIFDKK